MRTYCVWDAITGANVAVLRAETAGDALAAAFVANKSSAGIMGRPTDEDEWRSEHTVYTVSPRCASGFAVLGKESAGVVDVIGVGRTPYSAAIDAQKKHPELRSTPWREIGLQAKSCSELLLGTMRRLNSRRYRAVWLDGMLCLPVEEKL